MYNFDGSLNTNHATNHADEKYVNDYAGLHALVFLQSE